MRRVLAPLAGRGLLIVAIAIIGIGGPQLAVAAPAQQQRDVTRSFAASDGSTIELENLAGTITLEGANGGQIEVVPPRYTPKTAAAPTRRRCWGSSRSRSRATTATSTSSSATRSTATIDFTIRPKEVARHGRPPGTKTSAS